MGVKRENLSEFGVIFDVDGTMVDNASYHENAWIELGARHNLPITPQFYREKIHAKCNEHIVGMLFGNPDAETLVRVAEEKEEIYRSSFRPILREIPGLTAVIQGLHETGVKLAAASNSPKGNVDMVIDELGIRDYLGSVIDRDQVNIGKPNPELLLRSAENLGVKPEKCIVFEDSPSGFKAAANAGMGYIAITAGADADSEPFYKDAIAVHTDFSNISVDMVLTWLTN